MCPSEEEMKTDLNKHIVELKEFIRRARECKKEEATDVPKQSFPLAAQMKPLSKFPQKMPAPKSESSSQKPTTNIKIAKPPTSTGVSTPKFEPLKIKPMTNPAVPSAYLQQLEELVLQLQRLIGKQD